MKKKEFLIKFTMIDLIVVSVLLIASAAVPALNNLMETMFFVPWIYGFLCINLVIDALMLILNKFKKAGNLIQNMVIWFLVFKMFALFMGIFVLVFIRLAN